MLITETFESIQGEGPYMGVPMMFVRTNRCNLRCKWCDSTYTFSGGRELMLEILLSKVHESSSEWVCFTGGEPLLQRDSPDFVKGVVSMGKHVLIETGGSLAIDEYVKLENTVIDMDIKTPSSGEEKSLRVENLNILRESDYIKFVISSQQDYEYAEEFVKNLNRRINVVFQPAWGADLRGLTEKVLRSGLQVRVLPQLHKIIWGEIRGV